ncbi:hypothetical protein FQN57_004336 [Myotisia sp. PD_48]|nr:hypothetical protein FQN57_004336 [Myotisia sp. PD_48]
MSVAGIPEAELRSFTEHLKGSKRILALLGAGVSAASGLPTFRGVGGIWRSHKATDLATPEAFSVDPGLVWHFYNYRRHMSLVSHPNKAHYALAALARKNPEFMTITQNVDGLSERASHPESQLHRLHGSLFTVKCAQEYCTYSRDNDFQDPVVPALAIPKAFQPPTEDKTGETASRALQEAVDLRMQGEQRQDPATSNEAGPSWAAARGELDISDVSVPILDLTEDDLPHCPECKEGLLRPGVVWFGERLPENTLDTIEAWIAAGKIDLVLVVGTSAQVYPAAGFVDDGRDMGARVAVVNMDRTHEPESGMYGCDWFFEGDASVILPEILKEVIGEI